MSLTKKITVKSKSAKITQHLSTRKTGSLKTFISRKNSFQSSFPDKFAKANELISGAKLMK